MNLPKSIKEMEEILIQRGWIKPITVWSLWRKNAIHRVNIIDAWNDEFGQ